MLSRSSFVVATLAWFTAIAVSSTYVHGAQNERIGYRLHRVASSTAMLAPSAKSPLLIEADAMGGRLEVAIVFNPSCHEVVHFEWSFDKDIRFLELEEPVTITMKASVSGNCDPRRNPFVLAVGDGTLLAKTIVDTLTPTQKDELRGMRRVDGANRVYAKSANPGDNVGAGSTTFRAVSNAPTKKGLWVGLNFSATSAREFLEWQVAYLYTAVEDPAEPAEDIVLDTPGADSDIAPGGPGEGDVSPPTETSTETETETAPVPGPGTETSTGEPPAVDTPADEVASPEPTTDADAGPGITPTTSAGDESGPGDNTTPIPGPGADSADEPASSPVTPADRTLQALRREVDAGQRVLVPVHLLRPDGVANVNFSVTYDPSVAIPDGDVIKGPLLGAARLESNSAETAEILVGFAQQTGLARDGIVVYLPFRAVGDPGDTTRLLLSVADIDDPEGNDLPIRLIDGEIEIRGPGQGARGDCDGDGELTVADAICALKMSVRLMPTDRNLDMNGDGRVTSGDAREILQAIP